MKKNRPVIIVALLLFLVAAYFLLRPESGTYNRELKDFAVSDTSNITKIFLADKKNRSITITRLNEGSWRLNNKYPVRKDGIDLMLKTLLNLSVKSPVPQAAHNNIIRLLAANSVKVEVYQSVYRIRIGTLRLFPHEKLTKTYYVGSATQDNIGTYMLMKGSSEPFVVYLPGFRGFVSTRYTAKEEDWREHVIFRSRLPEIASISIDFGDNPEWSFTLHNPDNHSFELTSAGSGQPVTDFDTLKVIDFLSSFHNIRFESFLNDLDKSRRDSIRATKPFYRISLTDRTGSTQTVTTFKRKPSPDQRDIYGNQVTYDHDRMYALVNDEKDLVLVQFFAFDRILRPLPAFGKDVDK
jgi:hypothetical protein